MGTQRLMINKLVSLWDKTFGYNQNDYIKAFFKLTASRCNPSLVRRFLSYSILAQEFAQLNKVNLYSSRDELYNIILDDLGRSSPVTYIEFGVFKGDSIKFFSNSFSNEQSVFYGLDSFLGLPEAWGGEEAGFFSTFGVMPEIQDTRVRFYAGWFHNTIGHLKQELKLNDVILINFDADLYSSTLFSLCQMDELGCSYYAIFDEFSGDECRALSDYLSTYGANVIFFGHVNWRKFPSVVFCKISPRCSSH